MNRCSTSLIIREMKIETTMRYHLTPVKMVIIKNSTNHNAEQGVERREPTHIVGGNVNWYSHYREEYVSSLKKLKTELLYDPVIPTPGHVSREKCGLKGYMYPSDHCSTVKTGEQPKCSLTEEWIRMMWNKFTMEYYY